MRNYQGRSGKVGRNLALVAIAAVVLFMAAVLIGLVLQQRARESAAERDAYTTVPPASETTPIVPATPAPENHAQKGAFITVGGDVAAELFRANTELSVLGYGMSAVCFSAMDEAGYLVYASAVASGLGHVPSGGADLAAAVNAAHASGYAVSCLFSATPQTDAEETALRYNCALLQELSAYGVDEIILAFDASTGAESVYTLLTRYRDLLGDALGETALGVALPTAVYRNDTAMLSVAKISGIVDFLTVDFSDIETPGMTSAEYARAAQDAVVSLAGSFDYFDLRAMANGKDPQKNGALLSVLSAMAIDNFMIGKAASYEP